MATQLERDDPQSQENPVSGERRITLRLFPPPMEFPTVISADARTDEIESRSTGGQDETSPQSRAGDTPSFSLGADAELSAEVNEPQCDAAGDLAALPTVTVESTQRAEPVASSGVEAVTRPSPAAPERLARVAAPAAPVGRWPLVTLSLLSMLMGSIGSFGTWVALRLLHPEHASTTLSQGAKSQPASVTPNGFGAAGVVQPPTAAASGPREQSSALAFENQITAAPDLKTEARGLNTTPSQPAASGEVSSNTPTDRRDAPASVLRRPLALHEALSNRKRATEPEPGTPVDQIFVSGGGELVDAHGNPLKAGPSNVPVASTADEWIRHAEKDAGH